MTNNLYTAEFIGDASQNRTVRKFDSLDEAVGFFKQHRYAAAPDYFDAFRATITGPGEFSLILDRDPISDVWEEAAGTNNPKSELHALFEQADHSGWVEVNGHRWWVKAKNGFAGGVPEVFLLNSPTSKVIRTFRGTSLRDGSPEDNLEYLKTLIGQV